MIEVRGLHLPWNGALIFSTLPREWCDRTGDTGTTIPCWTSPAAPHRTESTGCASRQSVGFCTTRCMFTEAHGLPRPEPKWKCEAVSSHERLCLCPHSGSYASILAQPLRNGKESGDVPAHKTNSPLRAIGLPCHPCVQEALPPTRLKPGVSAPCMMNRA
jgi:hypothetical protein